MLDNRYQILQEIGSGGIGKVFKVTDCVTGETVALKVLLSQEAELVDRFKKEFLLLRRLDHPNIAKAHDFGITGRGEPFFTMEYIEGGDWKSFLQPLDYSKFWPLLLHICATLDFLHCQRIIHGDLKPSNILITDSAAGEPIPKFTDFGFAEYGEAREPGWWKGTLSYLAPEVIRGERYGCQADLYSLGVLMYETLFGKRPFDEEEPGELAKSHLEKEVIIPNQPPVTEGLKNLILKMLEKDPIDRCFSAREILDEVKRLSGSQAKDLLATLANGLISSGDFVGREEELSVLKEALKQASKAKITPVLILGESGIGKTRLLEEFKARAQMEGASVLVMSLGSRRSWEVLGGPKVDLLEKVSQPAVLIVEHLENAEDAELGFLRDLIHQAQDRKVLPCISITNELTCSEEDRRACEIEREIASGWEDEITRIRLENMSEGEAGRLVRSMFAFKQKQDEIAAAVYEKTRGSPLLIKELMGWLISEKQIRRRNGQWAVELEQIDAAPVPEELAKKIDRRLSRLNQDELDLLSTASVLGLGSEIDALSEISGVDPDVFQKGLENIVAERILVRSAAPSEQDGVCFPNGFTRDFVYEQIDVTKRRDLHRRVGRYLEEKRASETERRLGQLAHHFYQAGDDAPALKYALLTAEKAESSGKTTQAIIQYLRVLELYDRCPFPPSKPKEELYRSLAEQYEADGSYEKSLHYFQKALELCKAKDLNDRKLAQIYRRMARIHGKKSEHEKSIQLHHQALRLSNPEDSPKEYASLLIDIARDHRNKGEYQEALERLEDAMSALEGGQPSEEMGTALSCLAGVHWSMGNYPGAFQSLCKSLDIFQKLSQIQKTAECHIALGLLLRSEGHPDKALGYYQRALAVMERFSDPYKLSVLENNLAIIHMDLNRWDQALECLSRSVELKKQISDLKGLASSYNNLGLIYLKMGLFNKASEHFAAALELSQETRDRSSVGSIYYNLADLHRCRQEWREASHYLEKSLKIARELGEESRLADCLLLSGKMSIDQLDFGAGKQSLDQAAKVFTKVKNRFGETEAKLAVAELALRMKNLRGAQKSLSQARPFMESIGNKWFEGRFKKVCGSLSRAKGERDKCLSWLLESSGIFKELGARFELAKLYLELGKVKMEMGRVKEARTYLREALSMFEKSEVDGKRKEAEALLKQVKEMGEAENARIQTFYRLADLLNSVWDTDELLSKALELVIELLNAERGAIILYSEQDKSFEVKTSRGLEEETSEDAIAISRRILTDVIESDSPLIVENAAKNEEFAASKSVRMYNILSILCVPLRTKSRLIGTVYLDHRSLPSVFSSEDVDFLKAFASLIAIAIEKSELYVKANEEIFQLKGVLHSFHQYPHIVGNSAKMQEIFNLVERIADSKASVLIYGESGTGKELIAHLIHTRSQRKDGPFIRVNCAALPETLLESELFGIEEKTATGVGFRKGKFELADGGAIFLDEIGDMSLSVQAKVLRVLQEKEFERVGGQRPIKVDIRIISATNMDLQKKVEEGTFRKDLYYRLNPIVINIPALRDRKDDIPYLVQHYAEKFSKENSKPQIEVTRKIIAALQSHSWPGNVRELEHLIESATLLSESGEFPRELLPQEVRIGKELVNLDKYGKLREVLDWVEKKKIVQALERNRWNQVKAADELGLNEASLRRRIKKHRIKKTARIARHS